MTKQYWLLAILPLVLFCASASAQNVAPKLIDCHVHYNRSSSHSQTGCSIVTKNATHDIFNLNSLRFSTFIINSSPVFHDCCLVWFIKTNP